MPNLDKFDKFKEIWSVLEKNELLNDITANQVNYSKRLKEVVNTLYDTKLTKPQITLISQLIYFTHRTTYWKNV